MLTVRRTCTNAGHTDLTTGNGTSQLSALLEDGRMRGGSHDQLKVPSHYRFMNLLMEWKPQNLFPSLGWLRVLFFGTTAYSNPCVGSLPAVTE